MAAPKRPVCPQCGEPVQRRRPTREVTPQLRSWGVPPWSHLDKTPLCPTMTHRGYEPSNPKRETAKGGA